MLKKLGLIASLILGTYCNLSPSLASQFCRNVLRLSQTDEALSLLKDPNRIKAISEKLSKGQIFVTIEADIVTIQKLKLVLEQFGFSPEKDLFRLKRISPGVLDGSFKITGQTLSLHVMGFNEGVSDLLFNLNSIYKNSKLADPSKNFELVTAPLSDFFNYRFDHITLGLEEPHPTMYVFIPVNLPSPLRNHELRDMIDAIQFYLKKPHSPEFVSVYSHLSIPTSSGPFLAAVEVGARYRPPRPILLEHNLEPYFERLFLYRDLITERFYFSSRVHRNVYGLAQY